MNTAARNAAAILVATAMIVSSFSSVAFAEPVADPACSDTQTLVGNNCVDSTSDHNGDGHQDNGNDSQDHRISGTISGVVFNDLNDNGSHDSGEPFLLDWKVKLHMGDLQDGYNNPVVATDYTDAGGNYYFGDLAPGSYFVEEMEQDGWNQTSEDKKVTLGDENTDIMVNFANVMENQEGSGDNGNGSTTPPVVVPTTITIDASNVVCTNAAELPNWGMGGHGPITATTAKDWVAAHASCSLQAGWSFEYGDQTVPYGGDTTVGHVNGYTTFGPTGSTGSTTTTFTLSTTTVQVRSVLQDGFIPFTYTTDTTNNTVPSAQIYCATDALNLDNADFIYAATVGTTYYCVAFNSAKVITQTPLPAVDATPAVTTISGGNGGGGGGGIVGGPLSVGYVNTNGGGLVLGTSTEDTAGNTGGCSALLSTYMRQGKHNDKGEVTKLQIFLNSELGLTLPVTGYFGSETTSAVNQFQSKYDKDVLDPWTPFGLSHKPTGYVYKTTLHEINTIACSTLKVPFPQLP